MLPLSNAFGCQGTTKVREESVEVFAFGQDKSIAFERAMALPDKNLADGEFVSLGWKMAKKSLSIVSPLINSNGVHILTNNLSHSCPIAKKRNTSRSVMTTPRVNQ